MSVLLEYLQSLNFNQWYYTQASSAEMLLLIIAILMIVLPSALHLRKIALILLLLIAFHPFEKITKGSVVITILDVGQGLANVIRTQNHTLLFDTGSGYPSRFNIGDAVIIPYLRSKQIQYLDKIIISHGDNDHIGGLNSVLKAFNVLEIHTSVPNKIKATTALCKKGQHWVWYDVLFEILNPFALNTTQRRY
ncbi:MBL fold metallo-hydrolase [Isorropodon fossajaponicum symbiont]|uniref:MBL fold metallo-hydrolase n=1 Tax=Isorropodon fossajaponicum symbiont TaxID=883811 RepID=UPI00191596D8|nr:MBL fold metallo-hydrolase [Isorropodon fossajaponicum symbiont]